MRVGEGSWSSIQAAHANMGERPPSREATRDVIGLSLAEAMAWLRPEAGDAQRS